MRTVLVTAYAMNPYKGSEEGMGWNFTLQIARYHRVIAVTRINNGPSIRKYIAADPERKELYQRIQFVYFDWPRWLRWWKKGPLLSMIYYYGWQMTLAVWLRWKKLRVDVVHNLNFHNDWTPSFLWILGKPMVWGPVGHHPAIPRAFLRPVYGTKAWLKDRVLWRCKRLFWSIDPFLRIAERRAAAILCMNSQAVQRRRQSAAKCSIIPSVASEPCVDDQRPFPPAIRGAFTVLSAGRMVPLKGFDLTVRAFSLFYRQLPEHIKRDVQLVLIGAGEGMPVIHALIEEGGIAHCTRVIGWVAREKMLQMYRSADVFLFPSHEGAGMVVAEAMSHGLPVICLDNEGPGEFVHPQSRLKVTCSSYGRTIQELADRLMDLVLKPEYYQKEKEWSLLRFRESFDWDRRGEQLKFIYESICINSAS